MKPRQKAFEILQRVLLEDSYASILLRNEMDVFSSKDQALISELVYGTLRNFMMLHYQWKDFVHRDVRKKTAVLLSMSVYQLQYLNKIPPYAIVNEAVELSEKRDKALVNALLHKVIKRGVKPVTEGDEWDILSIKYSHPLWLIRLWLSHYGEQTTRQLVLANQQRPVIYGRRNSLLLPKEDLVNDCAVHCLDDDAFTYEGILAKSTFFKEGKVVIQDYSSQQVVKNLLLRKGNRVLDMCSAPGTKTQQMACLLENNGSIVACDYYENRLQLVKELMQKTGVTCVTTRCLDARDSNMFEKESFDRILVDAPCSGLGDLRHKPEIRYHLQPEDIDTLVKNQSRILTAVAPYLKVGGYLVYSTCTLNKKENEHQIHSFLEQFHNYRLLEEKTIFPMTCTSDGFYWAQLKRIL